VLYQLRDSTNGGRLQRLRATLLYLVRCYQQVPKKAMTATAIANRSFMFVH
jgi:hypothetical protein